MEGPVAVLYEHPLWFEPLFAELDRRGADHRRLHVEDLVSTPASGAARTRSSSTG